jgi:LmbE family N-acetylglucosaminyl deacetylase
VRVLALGAHPDDVEIGGAVLVRRLVDEGHDVWLLILTDDPAEAPTRRAEAVTAAAVLGVVESHVLFGGYPDGGFRADRASVGHVRQIAAEHDLVPDVVLTHTAADSHNDHVEVNRAAHAAFRDTVFLHFPVHISVQLDRFTPRLWVEVDERRATVKDAALRAHASQEARIVKSDLPAFERDLGDRGELARAEAFEVARQGDTEDSLRQVLALSESEFHGLWEPILGDRELWLLYESWEAPGALVDWPLGHEQRGRDQLRDAFRRRWLPHSPLRERPSDVGSVDRALDLDAHVLLTGGPLGNRLVREVYNRLEGVDWIIDHDLPRRDPAYLRRRSTGEVHRPVLDLDGTVLRDVGLLSRRPSPASPTLSLLVASGATSVGTMLALSALAQPSQVPGLREALSQPGVVEVPFVIDVATLEFTLLPAD